VQVVAVARGAREILQFLMMRLVAAAAVVVPMPV
jgi:hypothetical protein